MIIGLVFAVCIAVLVCVGSFSRNHDKKEARGDRLISYEEFLDLVWVYTGLPDIAKEHFTSCLKESTKQMLMEKQLEENVEVIKSAVSHIEAGSKKRIDTLVRESLEK